MPELELGLTERHHVVEVARFPGWRVVDAFRWRGDRRIPDDSAQPTSWASPDSCRARILLQPVSPPQKRLDSGRGLHSSARACWASEHAFAPSAVCCQRGGGGGG